MRDGRKIVFLLHGVDSRLDHRGMPAWFGPVRRELEAFFDVVELRYTRYDRFGKALVATFRGAIVAAFIAAAMLIFFGGISLPTLAAAVAFVTLGFFAGVIERWRRDLTIREVAGQMGDGSGKQENHLIAHSFGTFVFPQALERTLVSLQHVVLAGCVLPRRFSWEALWNHREGGKRLFHRVRNECSTRDRIAIVAGLARIITGLGGAGGGGFLSSARAGAPAVHDVRGPWGPCPSDSEACSRAPVIHNFALDSYGHSDVFLSSAHARHLWLPTFWSYDPLAFNRFVIRCADVVDCYEAGYRVKAREMYDALSEEGFAWFSIDASLPVSIRSVVLAEAASRQLSVTADELAAITQTTCDCILAGWQQPDHPERKLAYPRRALGSAIKLVLQVP